MNIFYKPGEHYEIIKLDQSESHHCLNVLRLREGDPVGVINGTGTFYNTVLFKTGQPTAVLKISSVLHNYDNDSYYLHIAIAPTKNIERFEWFLEKCTEIGVNEITPLFCKHSQRKKLRIDRMEKILISAIKQSGRATLPKLNQPELFSSFIKIPLVNSGFIAYCSNQHRCHLIKSLKESTKITVLIGPEGDFTQDEVTQAIDVGYKPVSLGKSRLRTETAGVAVAQMVADYYVIKDFPKESS